MPALIGARPYALFKGVGAFNYYVDSVAGSDSNSGRSPLAPFATLAAAVAAVGSTPNQRIGLAKGSSWRENMVIGSSGNGVNGTRIGAYGTGAMPDIRGDDNIPNANWVLKGGTSHTWQVTVSIAGGDASEFRNLFENDRFMTQVANEAAVETTPGGVRWSSYTASGDITISMHPYDGSDPTTNGKTYDYTARRFPIQIFGDDCSVTGIRTRRQRDNNGSMQISGKRGTFDGCSIEDGHKHNAYIGDGGVVRNCTLKNAYNGTAGSPNYLVFNANVGTGLGMSSLGNTYLTEAAVCPVNAVSSVISHVNTSGSMGAFYASGDTHTYAGACYSLGNSTAQDITGATLVNCLSYGASGDTGISATVTDSSFTINADLTPNFPSGVLAGTNQAYAVSFTNCTWNTATYLPARFTANNLTILLTGCTFTSGNTSSRSPGGQLQVTGSGSTIGWNSCTFNEGYNFDLFVNLSSTPTLTTTNNNTYNRNPSTGTRQWKLGATTYSSLATWQAASGQDANSTAP